MNLWKRNIVSRNSDDDDDDDEYQRTWSIYTRLARNVARFSARRVNKEILWWDRIILSCMHLRRRCCCLSICHHVRLRVRSPFTWIWLHLMRTEASAAAAIHLRVFKFKLGCCVFASFFSLFLCCYSREKSILTTKTTTAAAATMECWRQHSTSAFNISVTTLTSVPTPVHGLYCDKWKTILKTFNTYRLVFARQTGCTLYVCAGETCNSDGSNFII